MRFFAVAVISIFTFLNCLNGLAQSGKSVSDPERSKKANQRPESTPTPEPIVLDTGEVDESEVIDFNTELVTVPVRILDRKGRSIPGLKQENFQIFEDGNQQEIAYFSNERRPFTVALVLDMSYSGINNIEQIQQAAIAFVAQLQDNDRVMVISFDENVNVLTEPTTDRKELYRAIKTTRIASGTSVYDAIDTVVKKLNKIGGQKAIVLFSDGVDTTSKKFTARDNLRDILELDVIIYPIEYDTYANVQKVLNGEVVVPPPNTSPIPGKNPTGLPGVLATILGGGGVGNTRGGNDPNRDRTNDPNGDRTGFPDQPPIGLPAERGTSREEYRFAGEYLEGLANRTGGRLYEARETGDLALAFSRVAAELREFYSIGYYPPEDGEKDKFRKIKVKVDQKGMAVKARDGYVAKKNKE